MKKLFFLIASSLALIGCSTTTKSIPPEKLVVKETQYIVRVPPAELMTLPAKPADVDVDKADQAAVAEWLLRKEAYTLELENMLKRLAQFFETEQAMADAKAAEENKKAREAAGDTPQK